MCLLNLFNCLISHTIDLSGESVYYNHQPFTQVVHILIAVIELNFEYLESRGVESPGTQSVVNFRIVNANVNTDHMYQCQFKCTPAKDWGFSIST